MASPVRGMAEVWNHGLGLAPSAKTGRAHSRRPTKVRSDRLEISAGGRAMGDLMRTWGVITTLLGRQTPAGLGSAPDLLALREAILEAQRNLEAMRARQGIVDTLKGSVLREAERLVERYYDLTGDGARMRVVLEEDMGGALASISYLYDRRGRMTDLHLNINMKEFLPDYGPNGTNNHIIENDRIIAHEITHAVMGRSMDIRNLPDWFMEGTAEYIAGGGERVGLVLRRLTPDQLMARLAMPWYGDTTQYAASYIAVRYLDHVAAGGGGIAGVLGDLRDGVSLDRAIAAATEGRFRGTKEFLTHLIHGGGQTFMKSMDLSGRDPGSISGRRGPDIVPDAVRKSSQPMKGFRIDWPSPLEGTGWNPWPAYGWATAPGPGAYGPGAGLTPWLPPDRAAAAYASHRAVRPPL